jgi:hypothetical protein
LHGRSPRRLFLPSHSNRYDKALRAAPNPQWAVYVDFRAPRITNLGKGVPHSRIAISCPKTHSRFSLCVAAGGGGETT